MTGMWEALLWAFALKVYRGESKPHEIDFFIALNERRPALFKREDWISAVEYVNASLKGYGDES